MSAHAILSPSSAQRWLSCTPSARLEERFPDSKSEFAEEGTTAHTLGELLIRKKLKRVSELEFETKLDAITKSKYYNENMHEYCEEYAEFVMESYAEALSRTKDAVILLEERLNMTDYVPEGFGTGDTVIIADHELHLIDLKYGKGVPVAAEDNKQLKLYGLGGLRDYDFMYDIENVKLTIYQPRIDNISSWTVTVADLREWAETELKPKAALAFDGAGEFVAGKHCQFCRARGACKANADFNLQLARHQFQEAYLLKPDEVSEIILRAKLFENWLDAVKEHALHEAVENNKSWPGLKLVTGRSDRKYVDETRVATKIIEAGFKEEVIYEKSLLGITKMEKLISKKKFIEILTPTAPQEELDINKLVSVIKNNPDKITREAALQKIKYFSTEHFGELTLDTMCGPEGEAATKAFLNTLQLIIKPPGKLTLAPLSDKRPAYSSAETAAKDFADINLE